MGKVGSTVSCLCCPCKCLVCGLFSCLLSIIVSIVVIVGIVVLVLYLLFRPDMIKARVESAALTQFALGPNSTLQYNLALNMTVRNPNKRLELYYDYVEAQAWYDGARFGYEQLPQFFQGTKTTSELSPEFNGTQLLLGDTVADTYRTETAQGTYNVDVKVYTKLRLKIWAFKIPGFKPKIDCPLALPAPRNASSAPFQPTDCKVWL